MRHNTSKFAAALLVLLPGIALGLSVDSYDGTADCNGWSTDLQLTIQPTAFLVHLETAVVLRDQTGAEVERFDSSGFLEFIPGTTSTYSYSGTWTTLLDGQYQMTASYVVNDIIADGGNITADSLAVSLSCGTGTGDSDAQDPPVCTYPRPYWMRHRDVWPVTELVLGAVRYGQDELLDLLRRPPRGDVTLLLARQLIAAKLNLAAGADQAIVPTVAAADAYLTDHPLLSRPRRAAQWTGIRLALGLLGYNFQGCPEAEKALVLTPDDLFDEDQPELSAMEKEFVAPQNFGSVKSLFR